MCGISGFCNFKYDHQLNIERMMNRMIHRGPDSGGYVTVEDAGLTMGHRRLSIIDISNNGAQPMTSHNGRYVIVFNGEIYNYLELKESLLTDSSLGISASDFAGTSSTGAATSSAGASTAATALCASILSRVLVMRRITRKILKAIRRKSTKFWMKRP